MDSKLNPNEFIKLNSQYLRGTIRESLADPLSGTLSADDIQLGKFHGFYEQDDRDVRAERRQQLMEPYYSFMLRARLPGGVCTTEQWLAIDSISRELGNGSIRLTTRQTFQFHGIIKKNLKPLIQRINQAMIDSIGGCGDVNRNVMCNTNPEQSALHAEVYQWANKISEHLLPKTRAYHEIWLDGKPIAGGESEPMYGQTYLPRKFKTAIVIPPVNDVDVYTNDLGFVAIEEKGKLIGFNVVAGGGMGTTHDDASTFPRLADELGFITADKVLAVAEAVVVVQRDNGNRVSRRHARLKYTIERMGVEAFIEAVESQAKIKFEPAYPVTFTSQGDHYGWLQNADGLWNLTLYIENGRIENSADNALMDSLRELAEIHEGEFRITSNQNLIIANVADDKKQGIDSLVRKAGLLNDKTSLIRVASMACVALPTCPQAMAEAERYFPELLDKIEALATKYKVNDAAIVTRVTGCPNGCARPFVAEIALVGKGPGSYNLLLGGDGNGLRLATLYRKNLNEENLLETLDSLFKQYSDHRLTGERFGDFTVRHGLVEAVTNPAEGYHDVN